MVKDTFGIFTDATPGPHVPVKGTLVINQIQGCAERLAGGIKQSVSVEVEVWAHYRSNDTTETELRIRLWRPDLFVYFKSLIELHDYVEREVADGTAEKD